MAIIKGVKVADVSQVTPYKDDLDDVSAGIMAREDRANEVRNIINENRAAMLKQTRDHPDDMEEAQKLEQSFKTDVNSMLNQAGQDYSQVSKSSLQNLAMDYAGKTDFRLLSEAYRNQNEFNKAINDTDTTHGPAVILGELNPATDSFRDENNVGRNFTNRWKVQKRLNHVQSAKDAFNEIGHQMLSTETPEMKEMIMNTPPSRYADGSVMPGWVAFYKSNLETHKANNLAVDAIIQNGVTSFMESPGGKQYYDIHYDKALYGKDGVRKMDENEARIYAKHKVQQLLTTFGESEKYKEDTALTKITPIDKDANQALTPRSSGSDKGSGVTVPEVMPSYVSETDEVSIKGIRPGNVKQVVDIYNENTSTDISVPNVVEITNKNATSKDGDFFAGMSNPNVVAASALLVENTENINTGGVPQSSKGYIFSLGLAQAPNGDVKLNPTAVHIKHSEEAGALNNTSKSNYSNMSVLGDKIIMKKTTNVPGQSSVVTDVEYTAEKLRDELGDDLFHSEDFNAVFSGYRDASGNVVPGFKSDDPLLENAKTKGNVSKSFSAYSVNPVSGDIEISPLLTELEKYYNVQHETTNDPKLKILYKAKLLKIEDKISKAVAFKTQNSDKFKTVTSRINMLNEHNDIMRQNIDMLAATWNVEPKVVDALLDPKSKNNFKNNVDSVKEKVYSDLKFGLNITPISTDTKNSLKNTLTNKLGSDIPISRIDEFETKFVDLLKYDRDNALNGNINDIKDSALLSEMSKDKNFDMYVQNRYNLASPYRSKIDLTNKIQSYIDSDFNQELFNTKYAEGLATTFKTNSKEFPKFLKDLETMNDIYARKGVMLYRALNTGAKDGGYARDTFEKTIIPSLRNELELRKARFKEGEEEKLDREEFDTKLRAQWEAELSSGVTTQRNFDTYRDDFFASNFSGIRMDLDNESSLFVAHYGMGDIDKNNKMEHNIILGKAEAVQYFGIPAVYYTIGEELRTSLHENNRMFADIDGFNGQKGPRIHHYNYNQKLTGKDVDGNVTTLSKGQMYMLYDRTTGKAVDDPNLGSSDYKLTDPNIERLIFPSVEKVLEFVLDIRDNSSAMQVATQLSSYLKVLDDRKVPLDYIFKADHPFMQPDKTTGQLPDRNEVIRRVKLGLEKTLSGPKTSGFKPASSKDEYISTGTIIEGKDDNGKPTYVIPADKYKDMSVDDKKNMALLMNPNIPNKLIRDADGHDYPIDPETLTKVDPADFTHIDLSGAKTRFDDRMADFVESLELVISNLASGKYPVQANKNNYNLLKPDKKIHISSGLRSIQDNLDAYNNKGQGDIAKLTNSDHTYGQAIDVRTEPGSPDYEGGKALWEFLKTPDGSAFLKKHGLSAYYHQVKGNKLHIDIAVREPAGRVWDDTKNYQTGK